jgi:MYND finger
MDPTSTPLSDNEKSLIVFDVMAILEEVVRWLETPDEMMLEYNYEGKHHQMFSTNEEISNVFSSYHDQGLVHFRTRRLKISTSGGKNEHRIIAIFFSFPDHVADSITISPTAFAFRKMWEGHIVLLKSRCIICNVETKRVCSQCKKVFYCNNKCQRSDKKHHNKMCSSAIRHPDQIEDGENESFIF